jgi:hypothetical protein
LIVPVRRRWVKREPGEFAGAIRVPDGAIEGLSGPAGPPGKATTFAI